MQTENSSDRIPFFNTPVSNLFKLDPQFLDLYRGKQPNWGPLGYLVYKRTYARRKEDGTTEEFWETLRRVVEGTYQIQQRHCALFNLPFSLTKAQRSANIMFDLMWNFKFLPPGRGLWMMGTPVIEKIGGAALNNCFPGDQEVTLRHGIFEFHDLLGKEEFSAEHEILTQDGWMKGTVRRYGRQAINEYQARPIAPSLPGLDPWLYSFNATPDHRWYLCDNTVTTELKIGDKVRSQVNRDIEETTEYQLGFLEGLVYGKNPTDRTVSLPLGSTADHTRGFVDGWLHEQDTQLFNTARSIKIQSPDEPYWLEKHAALSGFIFVGIHAGSMILSSSKDVYWEIIDKVSSAELEPVFCFESPTQTFTLSNGMLTGNCAFVSTDQIHINFSAPFCFLMDMSMLGVGVGSDTRGVGLVQIQQPVMDPVPHVIPDTREGWVNAARRLLDAYVGKNTLPVEWDTSLIRGLGVPIKGFGGIAAGPQPLIQLLSVDLPQLLNAKINQPIDTATIVDIQNYLGKAVVSGNVRRSAEIMFGDPDDQEFLELKDPEKHAAELYDRRWASNNSVFSRVGMNYDRTAAQTAKNGEPGYLWLENAHKKGRFCDPDTTSDYRVKGSNPCGEQMLESFEMCCLVETFPSRHNTIEDYLTTLKYAYLYAKVVTLIPSHDERTNAIQLRNRRIGLSQTGVTANFAKIGHRAHFQWCDAGYNYLKDLDTLYSEWLCVPTSRRMTTVKPSGTVSLLPQVPPGIHFPIAEYYIRRIRLADNSPILAAVLRAGYAVEKCEYTPGTMVVSIPVKEAAFYKSESDVSMWEQLANTAAMQHYWSDNSVSVTIKFDPETEGPQIKNALALYESQLKSVSFLPKTKHSFKQPPYEPISKEQYEALITGLKPLDLTEGKNEIQEKYCDGDTCTI